LEVVFSELIVTVFGFDSVGLHCVFHFHYE
jgi:hypothetical protein